MSKIMLAKLAWNENRWKGWDQKGYENRNKYNYSFVREHGYAHEWWNFYDFDGENFMDTLMSGGISMILMVKISTGTLKLATEYHRNLKTEV